MSSYIHQILLTIISNIISKHFTIALIFKVDICMHPKSLKKKLSPLWGELRKHP